MIVKDVLRKIGIESNDKRIVRGITFDSRKVEEGYIFVAFKGEKVDGNDYIYEAFNKGALCVISDRLVGYDIYKSKDINLDKIKLCKTIYKLDKIKIIGITGTNGKTSSVHLLYQAFNNLGVKATYIGTLGVIDGDYKKDLDNTTPDMDTISSEIHKAIKRKCEYVIIEVSSHALSMNRVNHLNFDVIAFTNFSQDHLDYYKNMDEYFKAKKLLFDNANANCLGIINSDDPYSKKIVEDFKGKIVEYGKNTQYDYSLIKNDISGVAFKINQELINTNLIFETNIYNLILTYVVLISLGYNKKNVIDVINQSKVIDGRMEVICKREFFIILDYAHTPDAMERIIRETNKIKKKRCIVLFGCGGNRDKSKRPIMGKIATLADKIYITNDNPRYENDDSIIGEILNGIEKKDIVTIEKNREKAISLAIKELEKEDILLILGKGHEDYQIIKDKKIHLSDREIVNKCINN